MSNPYSYKGQTTMRTEYAIDSHELKSGQKIVSQSTVAPDEIGILTRGQTMTPEELLAADIVIKAKCAKMNAVFLRMNGAAGRLLNVRQIQVFLLWRQRRARHNPPSERKWRSIRENQLRSQE